jgi:hypothetical protein
MVWGREDVGGWGEACGCNLEFTATSEQDATHVIMRARAELSDLSASSLDSGFLTTATYVLAASPTYDSCLLLM